VHLFSDHGFRSEQRIKIAPEPAHAIPEEHAAERITQIRMDIQGIEVIYQIESAHRKLRRTLVVERNILGNPRIC
jgi:hypothetical protein